MAIVLSLLSVSSPWRIPSVAAEPQWRQVWADEFNKDGTPDPANWTYEHGLVRNDEAQWYQPQNAACRNGLLV